MRFGYLTTRGRPIEPIPLLTRHTLLSRVVYHHMYSCINCSLFITVRSGAESFMMMPPSDTLLLTGHQTRDPQIFSESRRTNVSSVLRVLYPHGGQGTPHTQRLLPAIGAISPLKREQSDDLRNQVLCLAGYPESKVL